MPVGGDVPRRRQLRDHVGAVRVRLQETLVDVLGHPDALVDRVRRRVERVDVHRVREHQRVALRAGRRPQPAEPPPLPQPAASATVTKAASRAPRRARLDRSGLVVGMSARSAMADPFVRSAKEHRCLPERCTNAPKISLCFLDVTVRRRAVIRIPPATRAECMRAGSGVSRVGGAVMLAPRTRGTANERTVGRPRGGTLRRDNCGRDRRRQRDRPCRRRRASWRRAPTSSSSTWSSRPRRCAARASTLSSATSPTSALPSGRSATALGRFGELDVLVNDAAAYPDAPLVDMAPDEWRRVFDVNVTGPST